MPPTPNRNAYTLRLPPHVDRELERIFQPFERHFKNKISKGDMVGALIIRARRDHFGLMEDLAAYLDALDTWNATGVEHLPEL